MSRRLPGTFSVTQGAMTVEAIRSTSFADDDERKPQTLPDVAVPMDTVVELVKSLLASQQELLAVVESMESEIVSISTRLAALEAGKAGAERCRLTASDGDEAA